MGLTQGSLYIYYIGPDPCVKPRGVGCFNGVKDFFRLLFESAKGVEGGQGGQLTT